MLIQLKMLFPEGYMNSYIYQWLRNAFCIVTKYVFGKLLHTNNIENTKWSNLPKNSHLIVRFIMPYTLLKDVRSYMKYLNLSKNLFISKCIIRLGYK